MNERIRQLAEQAGAVKVWEWASDDVLDTKNMDAEKFAELIVRECARVYWNIDDGEIHGEYVNALKKHFGVEE
jgi:hypothetical protein